LLNKYIWTNNIYKHVNIIPIKSYKPGNVLSNVTINIFEQKNKDHKVFQRKPEKFYFY